MSRRVVYILLALYLSLQVYANGDPVVTYSALVLTCTPEPRRIPEIQLVSENLTIEARCPMSHIRVKYVLKNNSDKYFLHDKDNDNYQLNHLQFFYKNHYNQ